MTSTSSLADAVTELAKTFTGQILQPTDPGYEDVRKVHNGLVDKRPALITRCRGVADNAQAERPALSRSVQPGRYRFRAAICTFSTPEQIRGLVDQQICLIAK